MNIKEYCLKSNNYKSIYYYGRKHNMEYFNYFVFIASH